MGPPIQPIRSGSTFLPVFVCPKKPIVGFQYFFIFLTSLYKKILKKVVGKLFYGISWHQKPTVGREPHLREGRRRWEAHIYIQFLEFAKIKSLSALFGQGIINPVLWGEGNFSLVRVGRMDLQVPFVAVEGWSRLSCRWPAWWRRRTL